MADKKVFCCPDPLVKNGQYQHDVPVTPVDPCVDAQPVFICGSAPPTPITLNGADCDGNNVAVTGNAGELVEVVQAQGTVFKVQLCPSDADFELSCGIDPLTDHQVQTAYKIVAGEFVLIKRWDTVTGAEWTGDPTTLTPCSAKALESDPQLMCDNGTEFLRWYVKEEGIPTGTYFDTDFQNAAYTVADETLVTYGACVAATVCTPSISSAPADTLAGLLPGHSISVQKNNCCSIQVDTDAGSFIVSKDVTGYSTGNFDCPVTVTGVTVLSGTCNLADIIITTQKKA